MLFLIALLASVAMSISLLTADREQARIDRIALRELGWSIAVAALSCAVAAQLFDGSAATTDDALLAGMVFGVGATSIIYLGRTVLADRGAAAYEWAAVLFAGIAAALFGVFG